MRPTKLLLLTGLLLTLSTTMAFAKDTETPDEKQAEYTLGEIVVSDSASTLEKSTTVTEITAEELKNSGARTLSDALKLVPGITTRTAADGTCRIDIRGMRTRQVKLLVNGIPIQSTYDGQFDPDTIPVENIARIKITQGATSVLYGDGGTAGVIDIITKKGTQETHGTAGIMAGQGDLYKISSTISGGNENVDYYVGASYLTRNHYPLSDSFSTPGYQGAHPDSDKRANSDRKHANILSTVTYKANEDTNLGATVNLFQGSYGKPPIVTDKKNKDPYSKTIKYERDDYYNGMAAQMALDHDLSGPYDTRLLMYGSRQYTLEKGYDNDSYTTQTAKNSYRTRATSSTIGLTNQWGYDSDDLGRFVLGLNGEYQNYSATGFTLTAANRYADTRTDNSVRLYSVALQDDITPTEDLGISIGASLLAQDLSSTSSQNYSYVIAGNYQVVEGTSLKLSQARKVRFPSIKNLYDTAAGNKDLKAEVTWHYEVGISQALPWASNLEWNVFRLDSENYIEKDGTTYQNNDKYQFKGTELTLSSSPLDSLSMKLGYTYMVSENLSKDAATSKLQYRPKHKATAEATYETSFGTTIFGSFRYLADQYALNDTSTTCRHIPDYAIVDVKVSQSITEGLSLYAGADNLTDTDYYESYGFPRPGRVIYTGMDYTF